MTRKSLHHGILHIISADSHMTEPADLWLERLDRKYRHLAPRVVRDHKRDILLFVAPGILPFPVAAGFGAGKAGKEIEYHLSRAYEAARSGGWDPAKRIKDQDADGVSADFEVGYFDQPQLTRSLKHFIGQTPAQI